MHRLFKTYSYSHLLRCLSLCLLLFSQGILANTEIGIINEVTGTAFAKLPAEDRRTLNKGDQIYESDMITTEANSSIKLQLNDESQFDLGPEAKLLASKFKYKKNSEEDSVAVKILKGSFRFVSGLIAKKKPEAMEVETSVATIGIRGTNVVGEASAHPQPLYLWNRTIPRVKQRLLCLIIMALLRLMNQAMVQKYRMNLAHHRHHDACVFKQLII